MEFEEKIEQGICPICGECLENIEGCNMCFHCGFTACDN